MQWYFNDVLIESSDRCMITFDGTYATLFIASCTMEDMGSFKVVFTITCLFQLNCQRLLLKVLDPEPSTRL